MKNMVYQLFVFQDLLLKGLELGKINGSIPQNIATVPSLTYL
jgi:hypothetical protein